MRNQPRPLSYYGLLTWIVPGTVSITACAVLFVSVALYKQRSERAQITARLESLTQSDARRVAAELLLGARGATESTLSFLKQEGKYESLEISSASPCGVKAQCSDVRGGRIYLYTKIPALSDPRFLVAAHKSPSLRDFLSVPLLAFALLPVLIMFGLGVVFQNYIFRRFIASPIRALVDTSTGVKDARNHWPTEIRTISERLSESFQAREQEVFAQIARGVIHDLRTLIQAPLAAVELVDETENPSEKRLRRLESLQQIAGEQLPKMRAIIDHTLDGSREITIRSRPTPLSETINESLKTLAPLIRSSGTKVLVSDIPNFLLAHDQVQLERALTNLLKNAIEATQLSPNHERSIQVGLTRADDGVQMTIDDSGPGLRFDPKALNKPLKSTKAHGSGLGLLVARKIIEAHGGKLTAEIAGPLGGAQFRVELPSLKEANP
jgi:signal transduction histidine kinase